jgi:ABC-type polysaccharide/polyol phosphate export permease
MNVRIEQYDSAQLAHPAVREFSELLKYRHLIVQLVARNLRIRYRRSILGLAWSMLGPLMTMAALSVVFTQIFQPIAPAYPVFLFAGLLMWSFFAQTTTIIAAEVVAGAEQWKRIYTPRTASPIATVSTGLVHLSCALVPLAVLMGVYGIQFSPALLAVPLVGVIAAAFTLGVGLVLAAIAGYFADVADLYQVVLGTWMYLTPVIYPPEILPASFQWVFRLNPMAYFVEAFRLPIYQHTFPPLDLLVSTAGFAIVALAAGWWLFTRHADAIARRS